MLCLRVQTAVFSACAEVVPIIALALILDRCILRVRGGSSIWPEYTMVENTYSPRARR